MMVFVFSIVVAADQKWFLVCQTVKTDWASLKQKQSPKNHFRHTGNRSGKLLLRFSRQGGFCLESTAVASKKVVNKTFSSLPSAQDSRNVM